MANLTLVIDEEVLRRARIRALEQGTSVNALVRNQLQALAGESPTQEAVDALLTLSERASGGSGATGRTWTRGELYEGRGD